MKELTENQLFILTSFLVGLFILICTSSSFGQVEKVKSLFTVSGDFGLYGDFYHMESDTIGAVAARRPDYLGRLVVNTTFKLKDFSLPITMALPSRQFGITVPPVPSIPDNPLENFKVLLKNPLNQMGIAPKYKWVQVLLGTQTPQYSELSVGDLSVYGLGFNLTPGAFRLSAFAGTSQLAIESDTTHNIQGIYARKIYSAKIGFGAEDSSHIYLIGSKMEDDTASLIYKPKSLMPQTGTLGALQIRLNLSKRLYVQGEIAGSLFTRNTLSRDVPDFSPSIPGEVFKIKESSRMDFASIASLGGDWKNFGLKLTGRYYGDGFVPLGYPFMQTDRLEATVDPRFTLFKNKIQLSGSIGRRINNLSGIRAATATQTIGAANLNWQMSEKLSLAGNYSNFGFRNTITNDTFKVEMVTESWSVSPSYVFSSKTSNHLFSVMYGQNIFTDFNSVTGAINNNDAQNGVFTYSISMLKSPLSVSTMLSYFENHTSIGTLLTQSANVMVAYKFFNKKLTTNAGLTAADNTFNNGSSGFQMMTTLGAKYAFKKKVFFGLKGSINLFNFGESRPGISYRENLLRTSITYKL